MAGVSFFSLFPPFLQSSSLMFSTLFRDIYIYFYFFFLYIICKRICNSKIDSGIPRETPPFPSRSIRLPFVSSVRLKKNKRNIKRNDWGARAVCWKGRRRDPCWGGETVHISHAARVRSQVYRKHPRHVWLRLQHYVRMFRPFWKLPTGWC